MLTDDTLLSGGDCTGFYYDRSPEAKLRDAVKDVLDAAYQAAYPPIPVTIGDLFEWADGGGCAIPFNPEAWATAQVKLSEVVKDATARSLNSWMAYGREDDA